MVPRVFLQVPPPIPVHDPGWLALFLLLSHDSQATYNILLDYRSSPVTGPPAVPCVASICLEHRRQCDPLQQSSSARIPGSFPLALSIKIKILNMPSARRDSQPGYTNTVAQVVHYGNVPPPPGEHQPR